VPAADGRARPPRGRAPVRAATYGHASVVDALVDDGVDLAAARKDGQTALHLAADAGRADMVRRLARHGAPLEAKNQYGGPLLDQTLWFDYLPVVSPALEPSRLKRFLPVSSHHLSHCWRASSRSRFGPSWR
jgi:hypothetical protein